MNNEQNMPDKSMMYLMKNRKSYVSEKARGKSYSSEFETLFAEHWPHVSRLLRRLVGDHTRVGGLGGLEADGFPQLSQRELGA